MSLPADLENHIDELWPKDKTPIFTQVSKAQAGAKQAGEFFGRRAEREAIANDLERILAGKSLRRDVEALLKKMKENPLR